MRVRWFNFSTRGFACRPAPKMVHSTPPLARWLRRSRGDRFGLQCSHCRRLFVAEIVLGSVAMEIFGPLVFSSVIATLTVRAFLGADPLYAIPAFRLNHSWEIVPYLLLGLTSGLLAPWFIRLLRLSEEWAGRLAAPVYIKMCLGGLIVGALAVFDRQVCGNGYSAVSGILRGEWIWQTVAVILVFKILVPLPLSGRRGWRRFHADPFHWRELGFLLAAARNTFLAISRVILSAFALVGMGAFLAAATHAPIMAIIMIFEITLDYQIILPLMLACVAGYYTSVSIERRSIYAEALKRKGAGDYRKQLAELHVRDIMKPEPLTISPTAGFSEIGEKFIATRFNYLYVTDHGHFVGAVSLTRCQKLPEHTGTGERSLSHGGSGRSPFRPFSPTRHLLKRSSGSDSTMASGCPW